MNQRYEVLAPGKLVLNRPVADSERLARYFEQVLLFGQQFRRFSPLLGDTGILAGF